jgi:thiamine pyrophosphate-dependent acetolactate synthase large subunit-like protein
MILFIGQVSRAFREREAFQEIDYRAMFGPLSKWVVEIDDASRIPELIVRAFRVATSGRPGPVVVVVPEDVGIGIDANLAGRIQDADLIIAAGTRLSKMTTSGYTLLGIPSPRQAFVQVHADPEEIGRVYQPTIGEHFRHSTRAR